MTIWRAGVASIEMWRLGGESGSQPRGRAMRTVLVALCLLTGLLLAGAPHAETGVGGGEAAESRYGYALAHELMSPYCPGRTLSACPSGQAAELRQWILLQEAGGATREEVISALEVRFGDQIRSSPEASGWGLAAWALPGAALMLGALMVVVVLRRMVGGRHDARASPVGAGPDAAELAVGASPGVATPSQSSTPGASLADAADDAELERMIDVELAASER